MEPVHLYGPIAWFDIDSGQYRVQWTDAVCFVSGTKLPIPLLVEHDFNLKIGEVTKLEVQKDKLVASCVVDDSRFLSLLRQVQLSGDKYRYLETGTFLNIFLPSFSSYHQEGYFVLHEVSLVDIGQRIGALWKVCMQAEKCRQAIKCRAKLSLGQMKSRVNYLLLRQRQKHDRYERLCRDADKCGHSIGFVYASSLSRSPEKEQYHSMSSGSNEKLASAFLELSNRLLVNESAKLPAKAEDGSNDAIYSYNDVKQMLLKLEKKHAIRDELERDMEGLVKRWKASGSTEKKRTVTGGHIATAVEVSDSENEGSDEETLDNSYTSMAVGKRIRRMMDVPNKKKKAKKARADGKKQQMNSNRVDDGSSGGSDMDISQEEDGEVKKRGRSKTSRMLQAMNERITQVFDTLAALTSANETQRQSVQRMTQQSNSLENATQNLSTANDNGLARGITSASKDSVGSKNSGSNKGVIGSDVKGSALDDDKPVDIIAQMFQ